MPPSPSRPQISTAYFPDMLKVVCLYYLSFIKTFCSGDEDLGRDLPSPRPFRLPPLVPSPPSSPVSSSGSMPPLTSSDQGDSSDDANESDDSDDDNSDDDDVDGDSESEDE